MGGTGAERINFCSQSASMMRDRFLLEETRQVSGLILVGVKHAAFGCLIQIGQLFRCEIGALEVPGVLKSLEHFVGRDALAKGKILVLCPKRRVQVLDNVIATIFDVGKKCPQRDLLVPNMMGAVIDENIDGTNLVHDLFQKLCVVLSANKYFCAIEAVAFASSLRLNGKQLGVTKIFSPHADGSATAHTDFKKLDGRVA